MLRIVKHVLGAARNSARGFVAMWKTSLSFRIEIALAVPLVGAVFWLELTGAERALLILPILLVLALEVLNSAVEAAIDRIGPERHPLSGQAKDMGSAAVYVGLVSVPVVWALVLAD